MEGKDLLHRCALCGGNVFGDINTLAVSVGDITFLIEDLWIGECEKCGERYHPAETSQRIEEEIQKKLKRGMISEEDMPSLTITSERDLLRGVSRFERQLLSKVEALETSVHGR